MPRTRPAGALPANGSRAPGRAMQHGPGEHDPAFTEPVRRLSGGTASTSGTTANDAARAPSQAPGTSSSMRAVRRRRPDDERDDLGQDGVDEQQRPAGAGPAGRRRTRWSVKTRRRRQLGLASRQADLAPRLVWMWARMTSAAVSASPSTMASKSRVVLAGLRGPLLGAALDLETVPPVAVGGVPQAVERLDEQRVVRGAVDRRVEPPVRDELLDGGVARQGLAGRRGWTASREVLPGASFGRQGRRPAGRGSGAPRAGRGPPRRRAASTRASRCASSSTRPCCFSRFRASRSGVVLMPISRARIGLVDDRAGFQLARTGSAHVRGCRRSRSSSRTARRARSWGSCLTARL